MAPVSDSEAEKADDVNSEFDSEPEQELSPENDLGMYTCLFVADDTTANQFTIDNLKKTWQLPIYTFFKPKVTPQYHHGWLCHIFACVTKKCKLCVGGVQCSQDSKDISLMADLKHHAVQCFGKDTSHNT